MTDPQNPSESTPPPGVQPPPPAYPPQAAPPAYPPQAAPPVYGQQPYAAAPPPAYGAPASPTVPGRTMGIIAFILSFFVQVIALILGIVALVQSRKAGHKNGFAIAAIIISSVLIVLGIIFAIVFFAFVLPGLVATTQQILEQCTLLGPGVHEINDLPVDCTEILEQLNR